MVVEGEAVKQALSDMNWVHSMVEHVRLNGPTWLTRLAVAFVVSAAVYFAAMVLAAIVVRALRRGRVRTLGPMLASLIRTVGLVAAVLMGLDQVGVNVTTLIAGAGVVGVAVGFGAQSLVKDVISGFFIIAEGALAKGDLVAIGDVEGMIESVGMRSIQLRATNGQLWYIPNGTITTVGNFSREWCCALVTVGVAYEQDTSRGLALLAEVANEWAKENEDIVIDAPVVQGITELGDSAVTLRVDIKVRPTHHIAVERQLRARIKAAFDAQGVEIPFPRQVVYHRKET